MDVAVLAAKVVSVKSYIAAAAVVLTAAVTIASFSKVPAQQTALAESVNEHKAQADQTNRKLDVLICLQAKLDIPIRCVAREHIAP